MATTPTTNGGAAQAAPVMYYTVTRSVGAEYWQVEDENGLLCFTHRSKAKCAAVAEFLQDPVSVHLAGVVAWHDRQRSLDPPAKPYLLLMFGDVDPDVFGPYRDEDERTQAARRYRAENGTDDGLFRVDSSHEPAITAFSGAELDVKCNPDYAGPGGWTCPACDSLGNCFHDAPELTHAKQPAAADKPKRRRITWVADAWINGRNATIREVANGYRMEAYDTAPGRRIEMVGGATFTHYGAADVAGDRWRRTGAWDVDGAIPVSVNDPLVEAS